MGSLDGGRHSVVVHGLDGSLKENKVPRDRSLEIVDLQITNSALAELIESRAAHVVDVVVHHREGHGDGEDRDGLEATWCSGKAVEQ